MKEHVLWTLVSHMSTSTAHHALYRGEVDGVPVELELCTPVIDGDDENPPGYGEPELTFCFGDDEYATEAELIAAVRAYKNKEG